MNMSVYEIIKLGQKYMKLWPDRPELANYFADYRAIQVSRFVCRYFPTFAALSIIGQLYLELYETDKQEHYLTALRKRLDFLYENWPTVNKESEESCVQLLENCRERWTWIDALFMGGPVWANMAKSTGEDKYLAFAEHEYWATFDKFWDAQESLLYRDSRFLEARDINGKKIFWARGNGWVFASLVKMIEALPEGHASRDKYIE